MKCHYEILSIKRDANDDEIKKSYRKLALQWHPDKNPDRIDEATEQFRLVQQAYEVLSDPHERAWYDKHREAILLGGQGHGDNYQDTSLDVYQFFNTSCYSGYNDDEKGFYCVFGDVFRKIDDEDSQYKDANDNAAAPTLGKSDSDYDEVVAAFYAYWSNYSTAKSYVWAEKYDTREAPSRPVRRAMELENKKLRDKARKERNEEVRELAQFVRKRDPRVKAYKKRLEERAVEVARLADEQKQRHREQQRKKMEGYQEAGWTTTADADYDQLEAELAAQFGEQLAVNGNDDDTDSEHSDEDYDKLFCVACNKRFRNEKTFANHEKSKKHVENMMVLQQQMAQEDEDLLGGGEGGDGGDDAGTDLSLAAGAGQINGDTDSEDDSANDTQQKSRKKSSKKKQKQRRKQAREQLVVQEEGETASERTANTGDSEQVPTSTETSAEPAKEVESTSAKPSTKQARSKPASNKPTEAKVEPQDQEVKCLICGEDFESRNKLFEHIKATGHAKLKAVSSTNSAAATSDKKSGQKQQRKKK